MPYFHDDDNDEDGLEYEGPFFQWDGPSGMCRNGHLRTVKNTTTWRSEIGRRRIRCLECERERDQSRQRSDRSLRERRAGAYPEHTAYRDTCCELNASCLTCPLPACRYDTAFPRLSSRWRLSNAANAQELRAKGFTIDEISQELGASGHSVFRWLAATAVLS